MIFLCGDMAWFPASVPLHAAFGQKFANCRNHSGITAQHNLGVFWSEGKSRTLLEFTTFDSGLNAFLDRAR